MAFNFSPKIVTNGLVLYLDAANTRSYAGSGTVWNDLSRSGNNGTLINGPTFNSGNGGSIVFDGTNDYVNLSDPISLRLGTSNFTFSLWFSTANNSSDGALIVKRQPISPFNQVTIGIGSLVITNPGSGGSTNTPSKKIRFAIRTDGSNQYLANTINDIIDGQWKHVTLVRNSGTVSLYVNNVIQSLDIIYNSGTGINSNISVPGNNWFQGAVADAAVSYLNGNISQTLIYNRALTEAEILQNYNATKSRYI